MMSLGGINHLCQPECHGKAEPFFAIDSDITWVVAIIFLRSPQEKNCNDLNEVVIPEY